LNNVHNMEEDNFYQIQTDFDPDEYDNEAYTFNDEGDFDPSGGE